MIRRSQLAAASTLVAISTAASAATAALHRVPADHATIQAAVDAASPGDTVRVDAGSYCGATVDKRLTLVGRGGPSIIGCDTSPMLSGGLRVGFLLPGSGGASPASGTRISGFSFDGEGVSNDDLEPLALGVLARFASDVWVVHNHFVGTTQAITNTAGDRWLVSANRIEALTLFDCTGLCSGGDGIVLQTARPPLAVAGGAAEPMNRPEGNVVSWNVIDGALPDGFDVFSMAGILNLAADDSRIFANRVMIPENPTAEADGQGILVSSSCCGEDVPLVPGSRNAWVTFNDGRESQLAVVVGGTGGANTQGLVLKHNAGVVVVEGTTVEGSTPRARPPRARLPRLFY